MQELEYLRASLQSADGTVRAYDTKSQIVLASTALSFNPIFIVLKQIDAAPYVNMRIGIVFCLFVTVLLLFLRVLAPVSLKSRPGALTHNTFFLHDPTQYDAASYLEELHQADLIASYADQVLKLHEIRRIKHKRFDLALVALAIYLLLVLAYGILVLLHIF